MRALVAVVALGLVLAGCADRKESPSSGPVSDGPTGTANPGIHTSGSAKPAAGSSTTTTTSNPAGNKAPTGTLGVNVPGGSVPLNVTFTLSGSDADNDPLAWTLDADGDGTADVKQDAPAKLPATTRHTYGAPGLFNVTYTLTDGKTTTVYFALVNVTELHASQTVTGGWAASSAGCPGPYDTWNFGTPAKDVAWKELDVEAGTFGRTYHFDFKSDSLATVGRVDFFIAHGKTHLGGKFDTEPFEDVVPGNSIPALISDCGGFSFTYQTL